MADNCFDIVVVGGGIVGCAAAYQINKMFPDARLAVLEKEKQLATHQTGRNSGVTHSGIYYKPGSLKAQNSRKGKELLEIFCREEKIPFENCGKVVVAVDEGERPALARIHERAKANGVPCTLIDGKELKEIEPNANGVAALHVPGTGIIDFAVVANTLAEKLRRAGKSVITDAKVTGVAVGSEELTLKSNLGDFHAGLMVNCAGLHCDRLARLCGVAQDFRIVPFRGEYYKVLPEAAHLCRNLIYPVPDPDYPFLGVHFTRMLSGIVECGPNAVFAFGREAYHKTSFNIFDLADALTFPGFWRFSSKHLSMGLMEMWRSWNKAAFVRALQRLVPAIRSEHLMPGHAGIRAQALFRNGALVDDFVFEESPRAIHVLNAPSPAATAALTIGLTIAEKVAALK